MKKLMMSAAAARHGAGRGGGLGRRRSQDQGLLGLCRVDRRLRLDLPAPSGPRAVEEGTGRQGRDGLCRERSGSRLRAYHRALRPRRLQHHLHDVLRLHGADAEGCQEVPGREVRARHRLQDGRQRDDLQCQVPRGPLRDRPDRGQDVEDRHGRLHRLLPDPGSHRRHQRLHARRAVGQSGLQGEDRLGQHLVRSRQGSRRRQGAVQPGRRHHRSAHRLHRAAAGGRGAGQVRASARLPT